MKICIVSPHIDDAVLSCGIYIQRQRAAGNKIIVVDIFSAGTNSDNRKKEEAAALKIIGAEGHFLDELDAPDRDSRYKSVKELFLGKMDGSQEQDIQRVQKRLEEFFAVHKIDLAIFPLGAGTHIDHRIAFEAGRRITATPVKFYEDRPYILWPGILQSRMQEICSDAQLPAVSDAEMRKALEKYHYLTHFMPPGAHREETLPLYLGALAHASAKTLKAKSEELIATEAELRKTYDSLHAYESQMKLIYADYDGFIKDSLAYEHAASGENVYRERMWSLT